MAASPLEPTASKLPGGEGTGTGWRLFRRASCALKDSYIRTVHDAVLHLWPLGDVFLIRRAKPVATGALSASGAHLT